MTYENPLRPSGAEAFDVGTVIEFKEGSGSTYEYLGAYRLDMHGVERHVIRDRADGFVYETSGIHLYRAYVAPPGPGSRWAGGVAVTVVDTVSLGDDEATYVAYRLPGNPTVNFRTLEQFTEVYKPLDN